LILVYSTIVILNLFKGLFVITSVEVNHKNQ